MVFYDFEVFKYDWLVVIIDVVNHTENIIVNDKDELNEFYDKHCNDVWVGYNSYHGLKQLEGFMGNMFKESDIDFDIDRKLTKDELDEVIKYCKHDVEQTIRVFINRKSEFDSQMQLIKMFK